MILPEYVTLERLNVFIDDALIEDVGSGDHTTLACVPVDQKSKAVLKIKDAGVLAGVAVAKAVLDKLDPGHQTEFHLHDGDPVEFGQIAFTTEAHTHAILKAERLILNTMQRMSGIASMSNRFAFEVEDLPVTILDTRKTTPNFRFLEKWAVLLGGCTNYRFGLYDWIMIKDNHSDASGGVVQALRNVKDYLEENNMFINVTVEVRNFVELEKAVEEGGFRRIMFDNFDIHLLREAVDIVNKRHETEASGGVTLKNLREVAKTGVDFISSGALTHSYESLDLSLKIVK